MYEDYNSTRATLIDLLPLHEVWHAVVEIRYQRIEKAHCTYGSLCRMFDKDAKHLCVESTHCKLDPFVFLQ